MNSSSQRPHGLKWLGRSQAAATLHSTLDAEVAVANFAGNERRGISLRLGALYGPESPATWEFLSYARRGIAAFPGSRDAYLPQIWIQDAVSAIVSALTRPVPSGIYDIVDDEPLRRGATLGELYRKLFLGWGVTIPAGISPNIGVGGHVLGGAFGYLCRQHGLAADHLYGVEVVVVDETGTAKSVVATREPSDPNPDLWWAHTGGGGGNFGIVTRYWFRSPGASGTDPARLLPTAPPLVLRFKMQWNWEDIDETAFTRLVRNHGNWCEHNSEADSPAASLYSTLFLPRRPYGKLELTGVLTAGAEAEQLLDEHLVAINEGVGVAHTREADRTSWLAFALYPFPDLVDNASQGGIFKLKDAFLRKRLTDCQIAVAYHYLTRTDHDVAGGLGMATYGGKVNTVAPEATASAQRESILTMSCSTGWQDPQDEARSLAWVRQFYRDLFSDTGGVPVPGEVGNGALINHPDVDLTDPEWNTSGVPWHALYYKDNYPRLQQIKARWDPRNVFHHALSIRPTS